MDAVILVIFVIIGVVFIGGTIAWLLMKERQNSRLYNAYKNREKKPESSP